MTVGPSDPQPVHARRLSDKILIAFNSACHQKEFYAAQLLLKALAVVIVRSSKKQSKERRRAETELNRAYERLWQLRQSHQLPDNDPKLSPALQPAGRERTGR